MPASEITDRSSPQSPPPPVVPDYELLRRIGSGAYGEVSAAVKREVARLERDIEAQMATAVKAR